MTQYKALTTKQLKATSLGLVKSVKGFNQRLQVFIGDFLVSWRDGSSRDNSPINALFTEMAKDKSFNATRVRIAQWVEKNSNYRIVYDGKKNYYGVKYKSEKERVEVDLLPSFFTTTFYQVEEESDAGNKGEYKDLDAFKKALINSLKKARKTFSETEIAVVLAEVTAE